MDKAVESTVHKWKLKKKKKCCAIEQSSRNVNVHPYKSKIKKKCCALNDYKSWLDMTYVWLLCQSF